MGCGPYKYLYVVRAANELMCDVIVDRGVNSFDYVPIDVENNETVAEQRGPRRFFKRVAEHFFGEDEMKSLRAEMEQRKRGGTTGSQPAAEHALVGR